VFLDWSRGGYFAFCSPFKILLPRVGFVKLQTKKLYRRDRQELQELKIAKKSKRGREEVPERCYAELLTLAAANRLSQASRLFSRNAESLFSILCCDESATGSQQPRKGASPCAECIEFVWVFCF
jgi:hypothetical protein